MIRLLRDLAARDLRDRRALVRVDYNVPLADDGSVADPSRVVASYPTLRHLLERGSVPVLLSHLGRPGGRARPDLSLAPLVPLLEGGLERPVRFLDDPDAEEAVRASRSAEPGTVLLAENVRFLPGETENDPELGRRLARLGDLYVNDAFGSCHREHASTSAAARLLRPAVAGLLVERELEVLDRLRASPESPYVVIFGGAKISDKIGLLRGLLGTADRMLIGGAMANTLLRARGHDTGRSRVEEEALPAARELLEAGGDRLVLPTDVVVAEDPDDGDGGRVVPVDAIPPRTSALDVGPETRHRFAEALQGAGTVFWNGPVGLFERSAFAEGTRAVARSAADAALRGAFVVVGGGDTARAVREAGVAESLSHVSTGGGAALRYLEAGSLPALDLLQRESS